MQYVTSVLIWLGILLLILFWLPLLAVYRLFDHDPAHYRTGKLFRKLGWAITRINPNWKIEISGHEHIDDRNPYIVVSNHLSNADIPVISNLPWEMKWVAKKELFKLPALGWMMKLAGDISVDRKSAMKNIGVFKRCKFYLEKDVSLMFFPEGTRSRSGKLNRFSRGAFDLAIREGIPVLPLVLDGTQACLPKDSWTFEKNVYVKLKILEPVDTKNMKPEDAEQLKNSVRYAIAAQLTQWRNVPLPDVDAMHRVQQDDGPV